MCIPEMVIYRGADVTARRAGRPREVGQPPLGLRVVVKAALDEHERAVVDVLRGDLERSAFLGVILTERAGRRDLLPQPDQLSLVDDALNTTAAIQTLLDEVKSQPERTSPTRRARRVQRPDATVRVHPDAREEFKRRARQAGLSLCQYNAEVIRERLGLATRADRTEALPLAM